MNEQQICWAFATLGLARNATREQVKHAYRLLCKQYHPDKSNSNNTLQMYLWVQQAYEIVCYELDFQEKFQISQQSVINGNPNNSQHNNTQTSFFHSQPPSGGRIIGNNETVRQNYNQMQQRQAETKRLRQWEDTVQRQKKQQKDKMVQELLHSRKLPSQSEQEKWAELEKQKEAERIAGIIQKILEMNAEN